MQDRFVHEPPLSPQDCASYTGYTSQWVRDAINIGVEIEGARVKLEAEVMTINRRTNYKIHPHKFSEFLQAIGWKHLPRLRSA
jgi:hypothetical protein